jgi:hypothetical protein
MLFSVTGTVAALDACVVLSVCPIIFPASLTACRRLEGSTWLAQKEM